MSASHPEPAAAARELVDRYWEQLLELDPLIGTQIGDDRFDDRMPDSTEAGRAERTAIHESVLREIAGIDRSVLDQEHRSSVDVAEAVARRDLADTKLRFDRLAAVSHLFGPVQLLADIGTMQRADTPERLEKYVGRLRAMPAYLSGMQDSARDGVASGVTAPGLVIDRTIAQTERLLAMPLDESPALTAISPDNANGREAASAVISEEIMPAYERYLATLREYRPHATETIGLYQLPGGEELYASQVIGWTTLNIAPEEAHQLGLDDFEKIQAERRAIATGLGFPDDPAKAIAEHTAAGLNTATSKQDLLRLAEGQVERGWDASPRFFGKLPKAPCEVRLVEEFREADVPMAFYMPATEDGSRPGMYYVNGFELDMLPLHVLASVSYHEANPGHHFQISLEQEMAERPAMLRFGGQLAGAALAEGWGLYCERLADEMDLYLDEWERLGMLGADAHRAARLVVDTGIHAFGWTRQKSIDLLMDGGVPLVDAEVETDRYITMPAQALSYKIGQHEISRLREEAAKREGSDFSLSEFHDRLLSLGELPLEALRRDMTPA